MIKMRTGPTNQVLKELIERLNEIAVEKKAPLWKRIAKDLSKSSRNRRIVNIYKLNKFTKDNETVVVPGKVLSLGELDHKLTVAAFSFSGSAMEKINKNGKAITITELMKEDPKGKNIRILG